MATMPALALGQSWPRIDDLNQLWVWRQGNGKRWTRNLAYPGFFLVSLTCRFRLWISLSTFES
jgi:hypothetical protein